jgi:XamI restriction endonuclease
MFQINFSIGLGYYGFNKTELSAHLDYTTSILSLPSSKLIRDANLHKIGAIIGKLVDRDIFTWLKDKRIPSEIETHRAATIVADRLCGAVSDPIIKNAQEERQLKMIKSWLEARGYSQAVAGAGFGIM